MMDDIDDWQQQEDTRSFKIWFKIDDQNAEPWIISDIKTSDYVRLKHNNQYAYEFIMDILNKGSEVTKHKSPEYIWKSIDDVDYTLLDCSELTSNDKNNKSNKTVPSPDNLNQHVNPKLTTLPSKPELLNNSTQASQKTVSDDNVNGSLNCNPGNRSNVKNKSKVWDYFAPMDSNSARCKFCQIIIKTSGNTSNLRAHLNSKHKMFIPLELQVNTKKRSSAVIPEHSNNSVIECKKSKTQTKMQQSNPVLDLFKKTNSYTEGGLEAEKLTNSLLYMIVVDHMPLRTVEKKGLQQFIKTARPQYSLPSRKTLTKLISDKYDVLKLKIIQNLDECPFYSVTCDIWTDVSQKSYLGTTVHYLSSNNLEISSTNLCVKPLDAAHNASYISTSLLEIFDTFSLQKDKITAIISDSAPNMIKAIEKVFDSDTNNSNKRNVEKNKRLPCFAHRLSHIVPKAIAQMPKIKDLIDKVKRIVMMTKKSVPAADELRRLQERDGKSEGTVLKFIQSVDTRWTSTYDMLQRFLLLEDYVYPVTSKCTNPPAMLSHEELSILKDVVHLIKPVMIIITELSGDSYLTCSIIIPAVAVMKNEIVLSKPKTEDVVQFKQHLLTSLDLQFHDIESFPVLSVATILDPRFKKLHFQKATHAADAVEHIRKDMKSSVAQTSTSQSVSTVVNLEDQLDKNNIWRHHDQLVAKTSAISYSMDGIAFELKQYITQPVIPRNEDPLKYWQLVKPSYPNLYLIAMKYFCVVGTSVPCERLFSEAGNIKTDDRNRLTGENLDKLLFLSSLSPKDWGF